jgi:hypothetical protein
MKKYIIFSVLLSALMFSSCVKDLDVTPNDPNRILSGSLGNDTLYLEQVLAKIYASFSISGQWGGNPDIAAGDENFFTTVRALWNLQEITTDEAICAWGDVGIADLNTQSWTPANPFLTALYQRLSISVTYVNDFINQVDANGHPSADLFKAEARFLRALAYYWQIDLFGNPPFTTEANGVGLDAPEQGTRVEVYNYIVDELNEIIPLLPSAAQVQHSSQASKEAAQMLLARLYLNAEVFTGTANWNGVIDACDAVIAGGAFDLAADYRQNFTADNNYPVNPEMIFAIEYDGVNTQGYVGTTFIIESSSDAVYVRAEDYHGLTANTNWNGNRARINFMDILVDTLTTYGGNPIDANDLEFTQAADGRVYLKQKRALKIPSPTASGDYGIGVYKFTARNLNGTLPATYNAAFACTDFPVFRLADAYLMRAEAAWRNGDAASAVEDINMVRRRAYGDDSGNITAGDLDAMFLLDERGREFYYEAQRRTDLVRFGQFTDGTYHWEWKGNDQNGVATSAHLDLFPIPADEIAANPKIKQNDNY